MKTPVANLLRYRPSGTYFARVRIRGKLFRQSLKTDVLTVAKPRLRDFAKDKQDEMGDDSNVLSGRMTIADAVAVFHQRLDSRQNIKKGAKLYRRKCLTTLLKSWPELESKPIGKVSKEDCLSWATQFAAQL